MVADQNNAGDNPEVNKVSGDANSEIDAAIAELKAAQAKLDEARAKVEAGKQAQAEAVESSPIELEAEPVSAVEAAQTQQAAPAPNWTPYTPGTDGAQASSMPGGYGVTPDQGAPVSPGGNSDPYAQAPYYAPPQNSGYQQQTPPQQPYYQQPYQQPYQQQSYQQPYQQQMAVRKDHVAAGLLAIFLGILGVHKFYLGYNTSGFIMLAVSILGGLFTFSIATWVIWLIAIIEGIIYLTKSQSEFEQIYVFNKREWF